ncbi:hypothetical protein [Alicyclobacillus mengziensis]|uniref:Uncharacterized protein n=1 Tax=Alicyclobacillus mengziensis TaxID=2931921 RepID=A0A9X7Z927_9BACL|nr:hypothetical protein [Alicyclobacillus mengziensis]QSO48946.1 hypothetical protein JZ786_08405 [Alicyclobacillus mengziensis]
MRTVKGQEAIDIARVLNVPIYDVFYRHEVTAAQAKQFVDSRRDPQSFVLENWPDTDGEAEEVVLHRFHTALVKGQLRQARIVDVIAHPNGGVRIHPAAARLAADRLVDQGKLDVFEGQDSEPYYRLAKNVHLADKFFEGLDTLVCDECAKLNFDRPFHETCLSLIMEHFREQTKNLSDFVEFLDEDASNTNGLSRFIRINGELLSRGLDEARSRFQSVLKLRNTRMNETPSEPWTPSQPPYDMSPSGSAEQQDPGSVGDSTSSSSTLRERARISKEQLIEYLRRVEILDETGEVKDLRERQEVLNSELRKREDLIHQLEKQRTFFEKQFDEMKRDMDTLVSAMQIAKKRSTTMENVIDVPMSE